MFGKKAKDKTQTADISLGWLIIIFFASLLAAMLCAMILYFHNSPPDAPESIGEFFASLKNIDAIMLSGVALAAWRFPLGLAGCFASEETIRFLFGNIALSACGWILYAAMFLIIICATKKTTLRIALLVFGAALFLNVAGCSAMF
jgi:hypothetical protein